MGLVVLINKYDGIDLPRCMSCAGHRWPSGVVRSTLEAASRRRMRWSRARFMDEGGARCGSQTDHCVVLMLGSRLTQHLPPELTRNSAAHEPSWVVEEVATLER